MSLYQWRSHSLPPPESVGSIADTSYLICVTTVGESVGSIAWRSQRVDRRVALCGAFGPATAAATAVHACEHVSVVHDGKRVRIDGLSLAVSRVWVDHPIPRLQPAEDGHARRYRNKSASRRAPGVSRISERRVEK